MSDRRQLDQDSPGKLVKLSTLIAVLCLLSSIAIAARDQPGLEIKVLPPSVGGQCPSVEERERVRNEIHQLVNENVHEFIALHSYTCNAPVNCMPQYPPPGLNHGERGGIDRVRRH